MIRSVRIKDHYAEQQLFLRRAVASAALILLAILVLIARLVYLQIVRYDYFVDLSQGNRIRTEPIPPNRGLIMDRNGVPLGLNAPTYQLELTREQVPNLDDTLQRLAKLSLLDKVDLPQLKKDILRRRSFEAVPIKLTLTDVELARFAVRRQDFPGVDVQPRMARYYPLAATAVHAVGYVSAISADDQENIDMDEYAGTTLIGKSGVEKSYEKELHGHTGFQEILVNAQGRHVERAGTQPPDLKERAAVSGDDVYLTIDLRVQEAAEDMLRGHRGAAVAIDPNNGDVLAFVSMPGFDPNLFSRGISHADYQSLTDNPDLPLFDRAIRGTYPSGSTIKPLMALAGLQYGVLTPDTTRYCGGTFRLPGVARPWRDFKPQGHGYIDLRHAIEQSCDVYFYGVANMLGIDHIHDFLAQFGFGKPTGIDIGGEKSGVLPSPEWKRETFHTPEQQKWYPGETINVGVGQGYLTVTPLELANAASIIAMRGKHFEPRLVRSIRDSVTRKVQDLPVTPLPPVVLQDSSYWQAVIEGMTWVTEGAHGTAQAISVSQYENIKAITKKLGERVRDHAWFMAFAPVEAPRMAVAVLVENGGQGGSAAAPIARRMFDTYFLTPEQLKEQDAKGLSPGITAAAPGAEE